MHAGLLMGPFGRGFHSPASCRLVSARLRHYDDIVSSCAPGIRAAPPLQVRTVSATKMRTGTFVPILIFGPIRT